MQFNITDLTRRDQPYLVAEIGVNHFDIAAENDISPIDAAKRMITHAAETGADAVKFQSYSADRLAARDSPAYWDTDQESTETQRELFEQYDEFGPDEFEELSLWTENRYEVDFLSTPFDAYAVKYLEDLVPAYKIASADITNHPLLKQIAETGKPIFLSTGASTIGEIDEAVRVIESTSPNPDLCLLHCILEYPTDPENANLGMIEHIDDAFPTYPVGYSDHVPPDEGMITLLNATVRGATVIEKHFTLDKTLKGNDHYHAMDPDDLRTFRENLDRLLVTTGSQTKAPIEAEQDSRTHARRSLVAARDIKTGEQITKQDLAVKRPGTGIPPTMIDTVIGRTPIMNIDSDTIITWGMI